MKVFNYVKDCCREERKNLFSTFKLDRTGNNRFQLHQGRPRLLIQIFFIVIKVSEALEQIVWGVWEAPPLEIFKNSLDQYIPEVILALLIMPSGREDGLDDLFM